MHRREIILPIFALALLLLPCEISAQESGMHRIFDKIGSLIKPQKSTNQAEEILQYPRPTIGDVSYLTISGLTIENLFQDDFITYEEDTIPAIYLFPLSTGIDNRLFKKPGYSDSVSVSGVVFYTVHNGFTLYPEKYNEFDDEHTKIDPYGVVLSDISDTLRIDMRGYISPADGHVTSNYGWRRGRRHQGTDIKVYKGDTIRSAFSGVVRVRRYNPRGYGNFIIIRHPNGLETLYGHLSKSLVEVGDKVEAGEPIGIGGRTGRATGYHLHFEFRLLGNTFNPRDAIDFTTHTTISDTLTLTKSNFKMKSSRAKPGESEDEEILYIKIRSGDTLGTIARRYGTTVSQLKRLNGLKSDMIRAGRSLRVR